MRYQVLQEVKKVNKNKQLEYEKLDKEMVEREKEIIKKWKDYRDGSQCKYKNLH